jgi:hypothetical protein
MMKGEARSRAEFLRRRRGGAGQTTSFFKMPLLTRCGNHSAFPDRFMTSGLQSMRGHCQSRLCRLGFTFGFGRLSASNSNKKGVPNLALTMEEEHVEARFVASTFFQSVVSLDLVLNFQSLGKLLFDIISLQQNRMVNDQMHFLTFPYVLCRRLKEQQNKKNLRPRYFAGIQQFFLLRFPFFFVELTLQFLVFFLHIHAQH